jgi:DNA-binding NtrC family response regulator
MRGKIQVLISSQDLAVWGQVASVLQSRGLALTRFHSLKEACRALRRENVLVVFCENQLIDGTYEDLLKAARKVRSRTRVVVTSPKSDWTDPSMYLNAKELGAFDVLREGYGPKDVEWVVICAIRDEEAVRAAAAWHGQVKSDLTSLHAQGSLAS